jgi:hypothetical protein
MYRRNARADLLTDNPQQAICHHPRYASLLSPRTSNGPHNAKAFRLPASYALAGWRAVSGICPASLLLVAATE